MVFILIIANMLKIKKSVKWKLSGIIKIPIFVSKIKTSKSVSLKTIILAS